MTKKRDLMNRKDDQRAWWSSIIRSEKLICTVFNKFENCHQTESAMFLSSGSYSYSYYVVVIVQHQTSFCWPRLTSSLLINVVTNIFQSTPKEQENWTPEVAIFASTLTCLIIVQQILIFFRKKMHLQVY